MTNLDATNIYAQQGNEPYRLQSVVLFLSAVCCVIFHSLEQTVSKTLSFEWLMCYVFVLLGFVLSVLNDTGLVNSLSLLKGSCRLLQSQYHWLQFTLILGLIGISTETTLPAILSLGYFMGGHWATHSFFSSTDRPSSNNDAIQQASSTQKTRVMQNRTRLTVVWAWWILLTVVGICCLLDWTPVLTPVAVVNTPKWLEATLWLSVIIYAGFIVREHQTSLIQLVAETKALEDLSLTDPLTGLMNRRCLNDLLNVEIARSQRYETPCSVVLFDIDHFKHINDTYWHHCGDDVLQQLAQLIKNNLRPYDALARYGGEEFALVLPNTHYQAAGLLMERLRLLVASTVFRPAGFSLKITISIGITQLAQQHQSTLALLDEADSALYAAKHLGRNQTHVFGVGRLQPSSNQRILNSILVD